MILINLILKNLIQFPSKEINNFPFNYLYENSNNLLFKTFKNLIYLFDIIEFKSLKLTLRN